MCIVYNNYDMHCGNVIEECQIHDMRNFWIDILYNEKHSYLPNIIYTNKSAQN